LIVRILLDENVPVQLKPLLVGHAVRSVNDPDIGWKGIRNGRLLERLEGNYDLLLTADKNLCFQQELIGRAAGIMVLPTNRRKQVLALAPQILAALESVSKGGCVLMQLDGTVSNWFRGE